MVEDSFRGYLSGDTIAPGPPYPPYRRAPGYYVAIKATPEERFARVRAWIVENLREDA